MSGLHDIWRPTLAHLLDGWTFADAPIFLNGKYVLSEFSHRVIKAIIVRSMWCSPGKLSKSFPISEMRSINTLLAFAATIARWAPTNLQFRQELAFDANFNHRIYTLAMDCIKVIRSEGGV
ncbi:hypothetical protein SCLCIDRAFT_31175 [Scleroderma citrinum Foug A]|uniref:Uncharacterized protein n=1 Tax=Scleroderma citrinum Foug A TaxID=1036808 RepID=A0A0C3D0E8_9AGAM|nr:hypothetical protein SCLCIDRAFT_31175 [Scleroderma citrinum Foug A]